MKVGSFIVGAAVLAAVALTPAQASAQTVPCRTATYSATLGLGGSLNGCFSFALVELGENAGFTSNQFYWAGNFGSSSGAAPQNGPTPNGTQFFNDDCGSNGNTGFANFRFCTGPTYQPSHSVGPIANNSGELVLGLLVPDPYDNPSNLPYWIFSGTQSRNTYPTPTGFQAVLYQLTLGGNVAANAIAGEYLFAWEDLKSGCSAAIGSQDPSLQYFASEQLGNAQVLDDANNCTSFNGGVRGPSDSDYNDSYIRISITGGTLSTVPEPMTMTLMATGLVGLAGAQFRRRRKSK